MLRQEQVVIIQKAQIIPSRCLQPGIGGLTPAQWSSLFNQPERNMAQMLRESRMRLALGIHHHNLKVRPGLCCNRLQSRCQTRPIHASHDDGNKRVFRYCCV